MAITNGMLGSHSMLRRDWLLITFFTGFLVVLTSTTLLFGIQYGRLTSFTNPHPPSHPSSNPPSKIWDVHHVPNPPPVFTPMIFREISHSNSFKSAEEAAQDPSWSQLLTSGGGFLHVQEPDGDVHGYGVSMFHQLHCLIMIRDMLLGKPMSHAHEASDWSNDSMHWLHCLDYLVQGVLCSADDTIERPAFIRDFEGKIVQGIDGMNHTHQCRNSKALRDAVELSEATPRRTELLGATTVFKMEGMDSEGKPWVVSES